jgi:two-component system, chemotaxis family, response regulator Rcp1
MTGDSKLLMLVEDSAADVLLAQEALADLLAQHRCLAFSDGTDAHDYLADEQNELPDLVLLDLNLPRMDGRELLQEIKTSARLRQIPVVILTTSDAPMDRAAAYDAHANSFVTKPVDLDDYGRMIRGVVHYWFDTVSLPGNHPVRKAG